jgi:hypothetical protein
MDKFSIFAAVAFTLSGCIQPDDLVAPDVRQARQELRAQQYQYLGCADLRRILVANRPGASGLGRVLSGSFLAAQADGDIRRVMAKKGCRLPQGMA